MSRYYVNTTQQINGDHEVHKDGCYWLTLVQHPEYLGEFANCHGAVAEARRRGYNANGCIHCCLACNTG